MPQRSAGIVMFRRPSGRIEVLLVHPGGPYWARKDEGAWSIPKGVVQPGEEPLAAARREFFEETGCAPEGEALPLGVFRQSSAKLVTAFAVEGDFDLAGFASNAFEMEWPPHSGEMAAFPEADRGGWFTLKEARRKILPGQAPILEMLVERLGDDSVP
ncbi:NUDIX domain-containing protein [Afifella sp. IM 167]|uniref:NUDIX domain-containing protein n=1 Tax=Afifella sp. IM 167 TaxID=2033586 RepID=UPI001CC8EDDD|nr:NUDIX domain-containing protein [Afifella sp. IM 167]MBZ8132639.1 NUDIX hydrolase [Afifella sp. IM 167]